MKLFNALKKSLKKKKLPWYESESKKAGKLFIKLISFRVTKIIIITILVILIIPLLMLFYFRPKPVTNQQFGVTFSWKYADEIGLDWKETFIASLDDLKIKNYRLITYWDDVEAKRDAYDYSNIKWQLDQAEERDVDVILAFGRKVPRYPECFEPTWWNDLEEEAIRDKELFEYIEKTVTELKGYKAISLWQVENEPFWPFGDCKHKQRYKTLKNEVEIVRNLDDRPILIQDSGEGGWWINTYLLGDYLGISMYRRIWYDFWGLIGGEFVYFKYPLANWTYAIKAGFLQIPYQKIIVTELQGEPWGPRINSELTQEEKDKTMSRGHFYETIAYAQKAGFKKLYLWGVEWWYWEMMFNDNSFFWDTARPLFSL